MNAHKKKPAHAAASQTATHGVAGKRSPRPASHSPRGDGEGLGDRAGHGSGGLSGARGVDAGEAYFAASRLHDSVGSIGARRSRAPAPGLHRGFGHAEEISASLDPVGLDVFGQRHAYGL